MIRAEIFSDREMKFKNIIQGCESLSLFLTEKVKKVKGESQNEKVDIITYYNKIFLKPMKAYYKETTAAVSTGL